MIKVLLTGGIGSGKSVAARILSQLGAFVYDSDSAVHTLYRDNAMLRAGLAELFGTEVLTPQGVNRKLLSEKVFSDAEALKVLEDLVHPAVKEDFLVRAAEGGAKVAVMESAIAASKPLFNGFFDKTVLIDAPLLLRIDRASQRDRVPSEQVLERIAMQTMPENADYTIVNDGDMDSLASQVKNVYIDHIRILG